MEKTKKVSKLELEILELESKLAPGSQPSVRGASVTDVTGSVCYDEFCVPRPEGAEC